MDMKASQYAFVILEDDDLFADWIESTLKEEFGDHTEIIQLPTEVEFWDSVDKLVASPPDVFILDVRVRWTHPGSNARNPGATQEDPLIAGIRCYEELRARLPSVPSILFTVLDAEDLRAKFADQPARLKNLENVRHVTKTEGMSSVITMIKRLLMIR